MLGNSHTAGRWVETLPNESVEHSNVQEAGEEINGQPEPIIEESSFQGLPDHPDNQEMTWQESAAQVEHWPEQVVETEERDAQQANVELEGMDENRLRITSNDQELGSENMEQSQLQEALEVWHEDSGFQEAVQHWLEGPSDREDVTVRAVDTYYFPDDDNVSNGELRELLNRYDICN